MAAELAAARELQQLLLPYKSLSGVDAVYLPALEVGGDFWQALALGDGGQLIAVGDVSGKGLKAAMVVSLLTGALRNRQSDSPAAVLRELNRVLEGGLHGGFVTAIVARFYTDGRVAIASAGHPAPYLDGAELDVQPGLPLGVDATTEYTELELRVRREQQITFVSDGIPEAANAAGELLGCERTREIRARTAAAIAEAALKWGQNDDITVVTVRGATA